MHSAPSVTYPVGRSRKARAIGVALLAMGAAVVLYFCWQVREAPWRQAVLALSWAAALVAALSAGRAAEVAFAQWDGQAWALRGTDGATLLASGHAGVQLDFQWLMLVHVRAASGAARWLWLDRVADPSRWLALRRALHGGAAGGTARAVQPAASAEPRA